MTIWTVKRQLSESFLNACLRYARTAVGRTTAPRSFERVCIVAALGKRNGITRGAELQYDAFKRLGIHAQLVDATPALRNPFLRVKHDPATAYIFHSGGPQLATLLTSVLPAARHAYRIAYWAWELPEPPKLWPEPEGIVSEIWTCSAYSQRSLSLGFQVPVRVAPHVVSQSLTRTSVHPAQQPGRFEVLVLADSRSSFARKNPAAAMQAFTDAFGNRPDVRLTIKVNGDAQEFRTQVGSLYNPANMRVIDEFLSQDALDRLFQTSHVLISLHRAEGFGLPMLEAMAMGIPVIATQWSGNLDFMDSTNSMLIPAHQVPVCDDKMYSRYSDTVWAEPDISIAAETLRKLHTDGRLYLEMSAAARRQAETLLRCWDIPATEMESRASWSAAS